MPAGQARDIALKPEMLRYLLAPVIRMRGMQIPEPLEPGLSGSARLWWFGLVPAWRHHLELVSLSENEIYTNERSGPVRVWNHRLTFTPSGEDCCVYTDEIEIEPGWRGFFVRLFILAMFRHRHRRWQALARIIG